MGGFIDGITTLYDSRTDGVASSTSYSSTNLLLISLNSDEVAVFIISGTTVSAISCSSYWNYFINGTRYTVGYNNNYGVYRIHENTTEFMTGSTWSDDLKFNLTNKTYESAKPTGTSYGSYRVVVYKNV